MKKLLTATFLLAAASAFAARTVTPREATNIAETVVAAATNGFRGAEGAARPLPKYLHHLTLDDTYPADAAWYYEQADSAVAGGCSARRRGALVERNYDWSYDESASFVLSVGSSSDRFASVGVASAGTHLTEEFVTSGKWSRYYKVLPGRTLDGINENGVVCEINVVPTNGSPWETRTDGRNLNAIGAVRWALDHAKSAGEAAKELASRVYVPEAMKRMGYSAHFTVCDADETWIVEDGDAVKCPGGVPPVITNFRVMNPAEPYGTGYERYSMLTNAAVSITSAWFRAAYRRPFSRPTEFAAPGVGTHGETDKLLAWAEANVPKGAPESLKRNGKSWQTVHTSVYDIGAKTLKVAVQETDDWYVFALDAGSGVDAYDKDHALGIDEEGNVLVRGEPYATNGITFNCPVHFGIDFTPSFARGLSVRGRTFIGSGFVNNGLFHYFPAHGGTFAMVEDISRDNGHFSNEVLAVGLGISTNDVAAIGAMVDVIRDFPIDPTTGATTAGALLAALAAAVAWLRRKASDLERRLDLLQPGFYVNGESGFATLAEAIVHAATLTGDVTVMSYAGFTLDGRENWALLGDRNVVLEGGKADRATVVTHTGADIVGSPRRNLVFRNLTLEVTAGTCWADMTLEDVTVNGGLKGGRSNATEYGFMSAKNCTFNAAGAKYAVDVTQGSREGDRYEGCTFRGFSRSAIGFVYHNGNVVFTGCTFDGMSVDRTDTVGLVNFQGGTGLGHPVFRGCTFRGLRRTVDRFDYNGPAIADRIKDGHDIDTLTVENCTIEDTVAYLIAFGDAGGASTHIHFRISGDGNVWTDWDGKRKTGTKMTPLEGSDGRYTGVGYLGDAPGDGKPVVEVPWEGDAAPGTYGSVGRA